MVPPKPKSHNLECGHLILPVRALCNKLSPKGPLAKLAIEIPWNKQGQRVAASETSPNLRHVGFLMPKGKEPAHDPEGAWIIESPRLGKYIKTSACFPCASNAGQAAAMLDRTTLDAQSHGVPLKRPFADLAESLLLKRVEPSDFLEFPS